MRPAERVDLPSDLSSSTEEMVVRVEGLNLGGFLRIENDLTLLEVIQVVELRVGPPEELSCQAIFIPQCEETGLSSCRER